MVSIFSIARRSAVLNTMIVLMIAIAVTTIAQPQLVAAQENAIAVATLVKRLGSVDFTERQAASKTLFERGPAIIDELKAVALSSNPELNQRVSDLIKVLSIGPQSSESREVFEAVLNFENAEMETRKQLLKQLLNAEQYEMYFQLIGQVSEDEAEDIFSQSRLRYLIPVLCKKGRWDAVDAILSHPLTWKYESELCGLYHLTMGTLDVWLDKMKREIDGAEIVDAVKLDRLIGLLKSQKQYNVALRYAKKFPNADVVNTYENQILQESGNWKELAKRAVLIEEPIVSDTYFPCSRTAYPIVKYWGGSDQEFREAFKKVRDLIGEEEEEEVAPFGQFADSFGFDPLQIHLMTMNWESAVKGIDFPEDADTIDLLSYLGKYDILFEKLGVGTDFESHQKWANKKIKEINKLSGEFDSSRLRSNQRARKQQADVIEEKISYFLEVCDLLGELGMEEEATLFIRQLYQDSYAIEEMSEWRVELIGRVADYGNGPALWKFIEEAGLTVGEVETLVEGVRPLDDEQPVLFGDKNYIAQFVYRELAEKIEDPLVLLKHVAQVINYQLKPPLDVNNPFQLDADVAMIEHSFSSDECWSMCQIYMFHQRAEHEQWLELAAFGGDSRAIKLTASALFSEGKYEAAAELYEQVFERTRIPLPLSLAAEAYGLAGDSLKARRLRFRAYVVPYFIYDDDNISDTYVPYVDDGRTDLIAERMLFSVSTGPASNLSYMAHFGWQILEEHDPVKASHLAKISLLLNSDNAPPISLAARVISASTLEATAAAVTGEYEVAERLAVRLLDFCPSNPSICEKAIVQLDLAGETEASDRVVKQLAKFYQGLLTKYPRSATHCNNYAWGLACCKRYNKTAIRHAKTAVEMRPQNAGFIDTLAESYYAGGDYDKAVVAIDRAVAAEPENVYYRKQRKKYKAAGAGKTE